MGCGSSKGVKDTHNMPQKKDPPPLSAATFLVMNKGRLSSNYQTLKKLGSGAFADVTLCLYKPLQQHRAVKTIHKAGLHTQQIDQEYMLKEISILTSLDHPNILKCYEIFEDNWKFYIAMDYCAGGELFDKIIEIKNFTEAQAAEILFQILSAISYCHGRKVTHRDLKPENILLEENQGSLSIKVADFGSSCFLDVKGKLNGCFGSAYYVAPEVLSGEYTEKCDLWSIGVIMFILLTGRPPYRGNNPKKIFEQVRDTPLQINKSDWPHLSEDSLDLMQELLTVNPRDRISAADALEHRWIKNYRTNSELGDLKSVLGELSVFTSSTKLQNAVHMFLATQAVTHEENQKLKQEFLQLDKNGDGKISRNELLEQYGKTMEEHEAKAMVERIMNEVDSNKSGDIDYTEFIMACTKHTNLLNKSNLEAAFKMFDKDSSGDITVEEIKAVFGAKEMTGNKMWMEIVNEVDQNRDGVIDLKEFIELMTRKMN